MFTQCRYKCSKLAKLVSGERRGWWRSFSLLSLHAKASTDDLHQRSEGECRAVDDAVKLVVSGEGAFHR